MNVNKDKLVSIIRDNKRIIEEGNRLDIDWMILNEQETKEIVKRLVANLYLKDYMHEKDNKKNRQD